VADDLIGAYLAGVGKTHWCDKSLSNVLHLEQLVSAWPDSRFVLLHRHCMDFVMSGLEASVWGLDTYGFSSYAQMSPTNPVIALIGYWIERTTKMLAFEKRFPDRCLRVRYEDLVTRTDEVVGEVWKLFGVPPVERIAKTAFEDAHDPFTPADYKIWFTRSVHRESLGRGARVPSERVPGAVRESMNELLERLDYPVVGDDWGSGGLSAPEAPEIGHGVPASRDPGLIDLRIVDGHSLLFREVIDLSGSTVSSTAGDTVASATESSQSVCVVAVERSALTGICAGTQNFGSALRDRTVRYYGPLAQHFGNEREILEHLCAFFIERGIDF
jgi:hypothetical protein